MRLRRFMRASAAKVGERRSPSWVGAKRFMRVGRVDGLRRGRREPIPEVTPWSWTPDPTPRVT
jgi:hypothetical protein